MYQFWRKSDPSMYHGIWGQAHPCTTVYNFWPPIHVPVGKIHPWRYIAETLWMRAEALHNICSRDCNYLSSTFHFVKFAQSGRAQAKWNVNDRCTGYWKFTTHWCTNDKKWPIDVPIKTGTPIHVPHFRKKKGPIDVPGSLILRPMFAAHPCNHFCTEYPPPRGTSTQNLSKECLFKSPSVKP